MWWTMRPEVVVGEGGIPAQAERYADGEEDYGKNIQLISFHWRPPSFQLCCIGLWSRTLFVPGMIVDFVGDAEVAAQFAQLVHIYLSHDVDHGQFLRFGHQDGDPGNLVSPPSSNRPHHFRLLCLLRLVTMRCHPGAVSCVRMASTSAWLYWLGSSNSKFLT